MVCQCFGIAEERLDASNTASKLGGGQPFSLESRAQLAVERRREAQEERKARLLDPKARTIGIDVEALNRQVEEKRRIQQEEAGKDTEADRQALLVAERGMLLERQVHANPSPNPSLKHTEQYPATQPFTLCLVV